MRGVRVAACFDTILCARTKLHIAAEAILYVSKAKYGLVCSIGVYTSYDTLLNINKMITMSYYYHGHHHDIACLLLHVFSA